MKNKTKAIGGLVCMLAVGGAFMAQAVEGGDAGAGGATKATATAETLTLVGKILVRSNDKGEKPTFLVVASPKQHIWLSNTGVQRSSGIDLTPYADKQVRVVAQGSDKNGKIAISRIVSVDILVDAAVAE